MSSVGTAIIPFEEIEIYEHGRSKGVIKSLSKVEGNALLDIETLENALSSISVCKFCIKGSLSFYKLHM